MGSRCLAASSRARASSGASGRTDEARGAAGLRYLCQEKAGKRLTKFRLSGCLCVAFLLHLFSGQHYRRRKGRSSRTAGCALPAPSIRQFSSCAHATNEPKSGKSKLDGNADKHQMLQCCNVI